MAVAAPPLDVLCVGNALVDLTVAVEDDVIRRHRLPRGDMLLTDAARFSAILRDAGTPSRQCYGGTACNTAGGVAAFGLTAGFVGKVAADPLGETLRRELAAAGIGFATAPLPVGGETTACCLILVTPDGQRTGVTHLGACGELGVDDVEAALGAARVVHTEAYLLDRPRSAQALHHALALGRRAGALTSMTLADPHCVGRHRPALRRVLAEGAVDVLFANEAEILALTGAPDAATALRGPDLAVAVAAVTRGPAGALIRTASSLHATPAAPVPAVVDATGAGDLYAAGVLVGILRGQTAASASRLGSAAAAEAISHFTGRPATSLTPLLAPSGVD